MKTMEELKSFLANKKEDVTVIIHSPKLSLRTAQAFLSWGQLKLRWSFIFVSQVIEKAAYQLTNQGHPILILNESEGEKISETLTRRILGGLVKSRRQERQHVESPVMMKKSAYSKNSPTGKLVQMLREGSMLDFSQGGAQITVQQGGVTVKDFISLMYRDAKGAWVSVESQVRWIRPTPDGEHLVGIQFLAVST
jgi:hypothetical protein